MHWKLFQFCEERMTKENVCRAWYIYTYQIFREPASGFLSSAVRNQRFFARDVRGLEQREPVKGLQKCPTRDLPD